MIFNPYECKTVDIIDLDRLHAITIHSKATPESSKILQTELKQVNQWRRTLFFAMVLFGMFVVIWNSEDTAVLPIFAAVFAYLLFHFGYRHHLRRVYMREVLPRMEVVQELEWNANVGQQTFHITSPGFESLNSLLVLSDTVSLPSGFMFSIPLLGARSPIANLWKQTEASLPNKRLILELYKRASKLRIGDAAIHFNDFNLTLDNSEQIPFAGEIRLGDYSPDDRIHNDLQLKSSRIGVLTFSVFLISSAFIFFFFNFWIGIVGIVVFAYKLRRIFAPRSLRVLTKRNAKISDCAGYVANDGIEIRANAVHARIRYSICSSYQVDDRDAIGIFHQATKRPVIRLLRHHFASAEDYRKAIKLISDSLEKVNNV